MVKFSHFKNVSEMLPTITQQLTVELLFPKAVSKEQHTLA